MRTKALDKAIAAANIVYSTLEENGFIERFGRDAFDFLTSDEMLAEFTIGIFSSYKIDGPSCDEIEYIRNEFM